MNRLTTPAAKTGTGLPTYSGPLQELITVLAEYEDAAETGMLIRMPCKLGTICYYVNPALHEVCSAEIIGFEINKYTNPSLWIEFCYNSRWVGKHVHKEREDSAFGKSLFFTEKEAEQALKEARKK